VIREQDFKPMQSSFTQSRKVAKVLSLKLTSIRTNHFLFAFPHMRIRVNLILTFG